MALSRTATIKLDSLGNGRLEVENITKESLTIGTDGLSSNISLNLWEEMRFALFMHYEKDLDSFAKELLLTSTSNGAKALNLDSGVLEIGKSADIISFKLPDKIEDIDSFSYTHHTTKQKFPKNLYRWEILGFVNLFNTINI